MDSLPSVPSTPPPAADVHADALQSVLRDCWGYRGFLPLQREAMAAVLAGRDSLVVLPTGGGKSLCYQAPAICCEGTAIVVSPLISLMKDQVDALRACGVRAACLNSSLPPHEARDAIAQLRGGVLKLLYVAPERLTMDPMLTLLRDEVHVSFVAIDEAHCVSMWGHDFRPHYRALQILKQAFPGKAVHAYTATATEPVRNDIIEQLALDHPDVHVGSFDRPNLTYTVDRRNNRLRQVADVLDRHRGESGIIYCISRKNVEEMSASLNALGHNTLPYHAGMTDEERHANQEAFIEDDAETIVATVAFGMGIDKPNVRYVVHAGLPKSLEHYQQESGRAGRDGLEAECALFYSEQDAMIWRRIFDEQTDEVLEASLRALDAMVDYCRGRVCRHRALVRHFDQDLDADCGDNCDVCWGVLAGRSPSPSASAARQSGEEVDRSDRDAGSGFRPEIEPVDDPLVLGQKILSSVYRQGQRFGAAYTVKVLKGSRDKKVLANGHDQISTHGILKKESSATIRFWIDQLLAQGFLEMTTGEYPLLQITDAGWDLLRGDAALQLTQPRALKPVAEPTIAANSWEGVDRDLFEVLRSLRMELAHDRSVPPYIIFSDVALRDMARRQPANLDQFLECRGVGEKKRNDFGRAFIDAIVVFGGAHGIGTDFSDSDGRSEGMRAVRVTRSPRVGD